MSSIKAVKGGFESKIKNITKAEDFASVGWFASDGMHKSASMTYPELAKYHATGSEGVTPRDVLGIASDLFDAKDHKVIKDAISKYLEAGSKEAYADVISAIGKAFLEECHDTIGTNRLPVTSNPTPLVDTSDLKDHLAYKTTKDPSLKR